MEYIVKIKIIQPKDGLIKVDGNNLAKAQAYRRRQKITVPKVLSGTVAFIFWWAMTGSNPCHLACKQNNQNGYSAMFVRLSPESQQCPVSEAPASPGRQQSSPTAVYSTDRQCIE